MASWQKEPPVADWVTIPDLYRDPFPTFDRLRAEGGVHWVPAINRFLVTSYAAVHETELDQEVYSADEEGSLMIRAMGHSMLRRDDPAHFIERRAWQPVLRPGAVKKSWVPVFERNADRYLRDFIDMGPGADLVWDFAAPYVAENLRAVIGLHNVTQQDLQRWSQTMIDATGNYADDPEVWAKGEASYGEVDEALDEMLAWHVRHPDGSLLSALLGLPEYRMPLAAIRANVKMTIGGGLNEPRDAIGVAAWALMANPDQLALVRADPARWDAVFDEAIRWIAPIGMYSRQTTRDTVLAGVQLPAGAKLGICILSANRDEKVWSSPEVFDIRREPEGAHLAFGKGVHVCLGAWVARAEVAAVALPRLFSALPDLHLDPDRPPQVGGWVFRGMTRFPVLWSPAPIASAKHETPTVAIVGSGPSGCYTAQALRRALPHAQITVIDRLPVPFGLVRYGVAADHQGTKAVSRQFSRLFEKDGVEFLGSVDVGTDVTLEHLRADFDAVVLATGLHADVSLPIPGGDLPGVHGAGRVTRLLNSHPDEPRPAPSLGAAVAVVGHGNVAMDLIRLLAKRDEHLADSDIDDEAHHAIASSVTEIHAIGRSRPSSAKFDPVMMREILEMHDVDHVVYGIDDAALEDDPRSRLVSEILRRPRPTVPRLRVAWYFGYVPHSVNATDGVVTSLTMTDPKGAESTIRVSDVITAIGFAAERARSLVEVSAEARTAGRIDSGLYVAGWARRGPRGTIPSQRADARELAAVVAAEITAKGSAGLAALRPRVPYATGYDGWLLIDAHESRAAGPGRVRRKLSALDDMRMIARSASTLPSAARDPEDTVDEGTARGPGVTVAYATESGNAELVAEELARFLSMSNAVTLVDLSSAEPTDLDPDRFAVIVCSTYGDGELPSGARLFRDRVLAARPDLSRLRYALFGMGDRSYALTYSRGADILDDLLQSAGAERVGEIARHDAADRDPAVRLALAWLEGAAGAEMTTSGGQLIVGDPPRLPAHVS